MPKEREKHIHINVHEYGDIAYLLFVDTCNNKTHARCIPKFKKEETFITDILEFAPFELTQIILGEGGFYLNDVLVKVFEEPTHDRFVYGNKAYTIKCADKA